LYYKTFLQAFRGTRRVSTITPHDLEAAFLSYDGCSQAELCDLMKLRGFDAHDRIVADYGGVDQLCHRLRSHPDNGTLTRAIVLRFAASVGL
jgi:hypothetical protein